MYDFLTDLDEYFCEKYADYDKICILPGYQKPTMHATTTDEFGRTRTYTLPAETMRLSLQQKKTELLAALKPKLSDLTFSFSFTPIGLWKRFLDKFSPYAFYKILRRFAQRQKESLEDWGKNLSVSPEVWKGICKGKFSPSKNLIFSLALSAHLSLDDATNLLLVCAEEFDFAYPKDVVVSYLLSKKIYDGDMVSAALKEFNVRNLFTS